MTASIAGAMAATSITAAKEKVVASTGIATVTPNRTRQNRPAGTALRCRDGRARLLRAKEDC
jgi:hypothetical protein